MTGPDRAATATATLTDTATRLRREADHDVRRFLQSLLGTLTLSMAEIRDPAARGHMADCVRRVLAMGAARKCVGDDPETPDGGNGGRTVAAGRLLPAIAEVFSDHPLIASRAAVIEATVLSADGMRLPVETADHVAVLAVELLGEALAAADADADTDADNGEGREAPRRFGVRLEADPARDGGFSLTVTRPAASAPAPAPAPAAGVGRRPSLRMRVAEAMARHNLGGTLAEVPAEDGAGRAWRATFPADRASDPAPAEGR
jgi:hypothetical protein